MKMDRGEYRSCYVAMADDADIHAMTGDAFKLLWMLKLSLPQVGIGVVYFSQLAEMVGNGCDTPRLMALFAELERGKPDSGRGWVVRDRNVVWVVNALACEPGMAPASPNHRKNVQKEINRLPEHSPVVRAFKEYYSEWFPVGDLEGLPKGSPGVGDPKHSSTEQNQIKGEAVDPDRATVRGAVDAPAVAPASATASPAAQGNENSVERASDRALNPLPEAAWRLLKICYDITPKRAGTLTTRQKQVLQDMRATLGEKGALLERGTYVRAFNAQHLGETCALVLGNGVNNPDAAIRLVLLELRKTFQERKAAAEKEALGDTTTRADGPRVLAPIVTLISNLPPNPAEVGEASAWLETQPEETRKAIEREVDSACPPGRAPAFRASLLADKTVAAWRRRTVTDAT